MKKKINEKNKKKTCFFHFEGKINEKKNLSAKERHDIATEYQFDQPEIPLGPWTSYSLQQYAHRWSYDRWINTVPMGANFGICNNIEISISTPGTL